MESSTRSSGLEEREDSIADEQQTTADGEAAPAPIEQLELTEIPTEPSAAKISELAARRIIGQELVRAGLAFVFVVLFAMTIVWAFANLGESDKWVRTKELLVILLPAETALLGSAVGFYFGSRR